MRLGAVTWGSDMALLLEASRDLDIDLDIRSVQDLEKVGGLDDCLKALENVEAILIHPTQQEDYYQQICDRFGRRLPIISFGHDQALWSFSNVPARIVATINAYVVYGGLENTRNLLKYLGKEVLGQDYEYEPPNAILWQGLYHPDAPEAFQTIEDYLAWYKPDHGQSVGILFFRTYWANGDLDIVNSLILDLETDFNVIPAFCFGMGDKELGAKSSGEVVIEYFKGRVDAIINLQSLFHAGSVERSVQALKKLDVPVFHPLTIYHKSETEWQEDIHGMAGYDVGWAVAMPEFEGLIEPLIAGAAVRDQICGSEYERHTGINERMAKIARRVRSWMALRKKPASERKVAFILHNNPCASVEATVGAGAHLDTLESVARIMTSMASAGYNIENIPASGKDLISNILDHKAISEFRWTPVEEIVRKGGALAMVSRSDYQAWFDNLSPQARDRICSSWGNPPGEEKDGVPPAMVYQDKIVITGVRYGNVLVSVQPKRGCAGARCDGQVCKILHDPEVPPTHQYLATYRFIEHDFGADILVHVGTHGNLEFLPGKSIALSGDCYPDIAIGDLPHLYIYNSDNPPEGTIAKRRSYAVLVDHMQTVMTESGLYGELKELEDKIAEYNRTKASDKGRAHALEHIILDLLKKAKLNEDLDLNNMLSRGSSFDEILEIAHSKISEIYNTQIPEGMHIFGEVPQGEKRTELINSILRYDSEMRKLVAGLMGMDLSECKDMADLDMLSKKLISAFLDGMDPSEAAKMVLVDRITDMDGIALKAMRDKVIDLSDRIEASDEMGSLLHGFDGGFIEPGPSGLITRGKPEVLPTGRNFYSLDPSNIPTEAAWRVGRRLAEALINKYRDENGRLPENVAMFWMANDIMWADGEQLAQMMYLIGAEPQWRGGKVRGFRIIPVEEMGRPRIDITVRVSGITRDCFLNCIEYLDEAIKAISSLDEPEDLNYLRKHSLESGEQARIFASMPGTYGNGVNLAVYASAWKEEKDLSDIFSAME